MARPRIIHFLLFAATLLPSAFAQEDGPPPRAEFTLGSEITTAYFYRGFHQEDQGLIWQPWIDGSLLITEGGGALSNIRLDATWWNSMHTGPTGTGGNHDSPELWYESRVGGGLQATLWEVLDVDVDYTVRFSPNNSFDDEHTLDFLFELDDSEMWGDNLPFFAGINPHALISIETVGERGAYLELGIEPTLDLIGTGDDALSLSLPVTLGTTLSEYYLDPDGSGQDDFIGFFDLGLELAAPLSTLLQPLMIGDPGLHNVEIHGGMHWLLLGDNTSKLNSGDSEELIFTVGGSVHF